MSIQIGVKNAPTCIHPCEWCAEAAYQASLGHPGVRAALDSKWIEDAQLPLSHENLGRVTCDPGCSGEEEEEATPSLSITGSSWVALAKRLWLDPAWGDDLAGEIPLDRLNEIAGRAGRALHSRPQIGHAVDERLIRHLEGMLDVTKAAIDLESAVTWG